MVYGRRMEWLGRLQSYLLPPRCISCGGKGNWRSPEPARAWQPLVDLCLACDTQLPLNRHACRHCGLPLSGTHSSLICGRCLQRPPAYQASFCAYEYAYPVAHLIRRFKYGNSLTNARVLSLLLARYLRGQHTGAWPDCFIPVPLHPARYRARGFNQVIELGCFLERELKIPMRTDLVKRIRHTPEQAGLSRRERRRNLRRVFSATTTTLPKHIALLDDVITTGSTVNELARMLRKQGVARIEVWGLARAAMAVQHHS